MPRPGTFEPGVSGNPKGRPAEKKEVKQLCQQFTEEAVNTLVELMREGDGKTRGFAAQALLDRGWGKPAQAVDVTSNGKDLFDSLLNRPVPADRSTWIQEYNKQLKESLTN